MIRESGSFYSMSDYMPQIQKIPVSVQRILIKFKYKIKIKDGYLFYISFNVYQTLSIFSM